MDFVEGEILAFDKPYKWTSFDVVGKARWLLCHQLGLKKLKVGKKVKYQAKYGKVTKKYKVKVKK